MTVMCELFGNVRPVLSLPDPGMDSMSSLNVVAHVFSWPVVSARGDVSLTSSPLGRLEA